MTKAIKKKITISKEQIITLAKQHPKITLATTALGVLLITCLIFSNRTYICEQDVACPDLEDLMEGEKVTKHYTNEPISGFVKGGNRRGQRFEAYVKNGSLHGHLKAYDRNGDLLFDGYYKNGKKHGISKIYEDKILQAEIAFNDGIREGSYKEYHDNGQLAAKGNTKNDKKHGLFTVYNKQGILIKEINYQNDIEDGLYKEYEDGKLAYEEVKENGTILSSKTYYDDGKSVHIEIIYKNGKEYESKLYCKNGKLGLYENKETGDSQVSKCSE